MSELSAGGSGHGRDRADGVAGLREELAQVRRERDDLAAENERLRRALAAGEAPVEETFEHGADSREAVGRTGGRLFVPTSPLAVCRLVSSVCLDSALVFWDLSDEIPREVHVAVPSGAHRPTIDYPPTRVHVFAADTFDLGRHEVVGEAGERFWISNRERTVVDVFRLRHLVGEDLAYSALRQYLRSRPKLARLAEVAQALRAWGPLSDALQVLQA